ncbi:MAG TPA: fumarate/nitrate reduction transcriptional regulator Fnr [Candidatus Acidoferrum sp.]|nr:fumarate/nitrate reduction transcriptional regulator Fnr [Candidatus Acidoferrum sp.]
MSSTIASTGKQSACGHGFIKATCSECSLKELCLPIAMDIPDIDRLDQIIQRSRPLHAGDHLYRTGDPFKSIYAVRSGSIKTYLVDEDGIEQVTGFYLPGEVLGFDGIGTDNHACNVVALETSSVCEIPFDRLEELTKQIPVLQHHIFQLMGKQIESDHQMMLTLSKKNAEGRIATLLISLSARYARRHLSSSAMRLPMSRMDMGNFLGLTIETVSRTLSRLHKDDVIGVDGREIVIKNREKLDELCHQLQ